MTLIRNQEELDRIVREAEELAGTGGPAPAASDNGAGVPTEAPAPASCSEIADLGLLLINGGYMLAFGPAGVLPPDLQREAKKNLELICAKYLPSTVAAFGPESALVAVLAVHTLNCYRLCQTSARSPELSASAEAGNQP